MRMPRRAGLVWLLSAAALTAQHSWQQIDGPTLTAYPFNSPGSFRAPSAFDGSRNRLVLVDHAERLFEHDGANWLYRGFAGSSSFVLHDPVGDRIVKGLVNDGVLRIATW